MSTFLLFPVLHLLVSICVCAFLCSHASSRTCAQLQADRSGLGGLDRRGKEVGGGIDKAVNEVIGRINGDPRGNNEHVCLSVCGSGGIGCYGSVTQSECPSRVRYIIELAAASVAALCLIHPCDRTMEQHGTTLWALAPIVRTVKGPGHNIHHHSWAFTGFVVLYSLHSGFFLTYIIWMDQ